MAADPLQSGRCPSCHWAGGHSTVATTNATPLLVDPLIARSDRLLARTQSLWERLRAVESAATWACPGSAQP